jgi:hypothetical protein
LPRTHQHRIQVGVVDDVPLRAADPHVAPTSGRVPAPGRSGG